MAILILILSFFVFIGSTKNIKKLYISSIVLLIYAILIILDQLYLQTAFSRAFHFSDPGAYFQYVKDIKNFSGLITFYKSPEFKGETNHLYFYLNWVFKKTFKLPHISALMLLLNNALIYLTAYNLITQDKQKLTIIDAILLFHPFLVFTIIRNVRDVYIIFSMVLFIHSLNNKLPKLNKQIAFIVSIILILLLRYFFVVIMVGILFYKYKEGISKKYKRIFIWSIGSGVLLIFILYQHEILKIVYKAFYSALYYHGEIDYNNVDRVSKIDNVLASGSISFYALKDIFIRLLKAFPMFLLTPHPFVYLERYIEGRAEGVYNIYTDVDNVLIILGSLLNYFLVFPILFKFFHKIKTIPNNFKITVIFIILFYCIFQLGITDIRIRYTMMFFVFIGFKIADFDIRLNMRNLKYYIISLSIMLLYMFVLFV